MSYCDQNSNHKGKVTRVQALKALALKFTENNLVLSSGRWWERGSTELGAW